jgi:RluA family pseudouridine synthase
MIVTKNDLDPSLILYDDSDLLVFNKPAQLLSVEDGYQADLPHIRSVLEPHFGDLWIVHRLDKETSGIVLIARNADVHRSLNADFRNHQVHKTYHGLVTPPPQWTDLDINLPLKPNADRKHRTRVDFEHGKEAHSICRVLKRYALGVLMEIQILTGITHQIRAHLRENKLVLLGDSLYNAGLPPQPITFSRTMLHARTITFIHPVNKTQMTFTAPYPSDFRDAYTNLRFTTEMDAAL